MEKDILKEVAEYYQKILNEKDFIIQAGKNGKKIEFVLSFESSNFKHLIGLHKLKDVAVCRENSSVLFSYILEGKVTYSDISKSRYFYDITERINNFQKIGDTLSKNSNLLESPDGHFKTINADFLVCKNIGDEKIIYSHLFLKGDRERGIVVPVSYFSRSDSKYLNLNAKRWTILNVERKEPEITKQKEEPKVEILESQKESKKTLNIDLEEVYEVNHLPDISKEIEGKELSKNDKVYETVYETKETGEIILKQYEVKEQDVDAFLKEKAKHEQIQKEFEEKPFTFPFEKDFDIKGEIEQPESELEKDIEAKKELQAEDECEREDNGREI